MPIVAVSELAVPDETIDEQVIAKYLQVVPPKFRQIALVDLSKLTIEDVTRWLKAVENQVEAMAQMTASRKLLLTEEWAARVCKQHLGQGSTSSRRHGATMRKPATATV